jgi:hypothetical protein
VRDIDYTDANVVDVSAGRERCGCHSRAIDRGLGTEVHAATGKKIICEQI